MSRAPSTWTLAIGLVRREIKCDKNVMKMIMSFVIPPAPAWLGPWTDNNAHRVLFIAGGGVSAVWSWKGGRPRVVTDVYSDAADELGDTWVGSLCYFCGRLIDGRHVPEWMWDGKCISPCAWCYEQIFVGKN